MGNVSRLSLLLAASLFAPAAAPAQAPSSAWLSLLPDGEEKRKFILDCTGCHQFDAITARADAGRRTRTREEWQQAVTRMLGFAGAASSFPIMAADRDAAATAAWLTIGLGSEIPGADTTSRASPNITEFPIPEAGDLPHDVAVDSTGKILITGMFTGRIYVLDPASASFQLVGTPFPNPRAIELDRQGNWWVALGNPRMLARYAPVTREWTTYPIGMYPHSVALSADGSAWGNGHFTGGSNTAELIARVGGGSDSARKLTAPPHPVLGARPGGPIPYEIRTAPDGRVWMSELVGNRMVVFDPVSGRSEAFDLPGTFAGPRRFDIDSSGVLWIPAYAANELIRFDPRTRQFRRFPTPIRDSNPYVVRVDHGRGVLWIGTGAADVVYRFEIRGERFETYHLPSRGALVRHLAIDPRTHDVWLAYGASPSRIPAKVARLAGADRR